MFPTKDPFSDYGRFVFLSGLSAVERKNTILSLVLKVNVRKQNTSNQTSFTKWYCGLSQMNKTFFKHVNRSYKNILLICQI